MFQLFLDQCLDKLLNKHLASNVTSSLPAASDLNSERLSDVECSKVTSNSEVSESSLHEYSKWKLVFFSTLILMASLCLLLLLTSSSASAGNLMQQTPSNSPAAVFVSALCDLVSSGLKITHNMFWKKSEMDFFSWFGNNTGPVINILYYPDTNNDTGFFTWYRNVTDVFLNSRYYHSNSTGLSTWWHRNVNCTFFNTRYYHSNATSDSLNSTLPGVYRRVERFVIVVAVCTVAMTAAIGKFCIRAYQRFAKDNSSPSSSSPSFPSSSSPSPSSYSPSSSATASRGSLPRLGCVPLVILLVFTQVVGAAPQNTTNEVGFAVCVPDDEVPPPRFDQCRDPPELEPDTCPVVTTQSAQYVVASLNQFLPVLLHSTTDGTSSRVTDSCLAVSLLPNLSESRIIILCIAVALCGPVGPLVLVTFAYLCSTPFFFIRSIVFTYGRLAKRAGTRGFSLTKHAFRLILAHFTPLQHGFLICLLKLPRTVHLLIPSSLYVVSFCLCHYGLFSLWVNTAFGVATLTALGLAIMLSPIRHEFEDEQEALFQDDSSPELDVKDDHQHDKSKLAVSKSKSQENSSDSSKLYYPDHEITTPSVVRNGVPIQGYSAHLMNVSDQWRNRIKQAVTKNESLFFVYNQTAAQQQGNACLRPPNHMPGNSQPYYGFPPDLVLQPSIFRHRHCIWEGAREAGVDSVHIDVVHHISSTHSYSSLVEKKSVQAGLRDEMSNQLLVAGVAAWPGIWTS